MTSLLALPLSGIIADAMGEWLQVATLMTRKAPKTPMAFYNRTLVVIGATLVAVLYSNIDPRHKGVSLIVGGVLLVGINVWVSVFSWKKPRFLLYGAETHFEEWKMEVERKEAGSGKSLPPRGPGDDIPENVIANE